VVIVDGACPSPKLVAIPASARRGERPRGLT
jgi:hypothetical protein